MSSELSIARQVPLAPRTTLQLGGAAEFYCEASTPGQVEAALGWAAARELPVTLLAGGSNTVVADGGVPGLTLGLSLRGVTFTEASGSVLVTAMAGEPFEALVAQVVARDLGGIECLSGIPGSVGATPVQNVGAYGQEVADVIVAVTAWDRVQQATVTMGPADCAFRYRDSAFKRDPGRFVVLSVTYRLTPGAAPSLRYAELARALRQADGGPASLAGVREAVLRLRASKSMLVDPADENHRSVGSFFTNPIVSEATAEALVAGALAAGLVETPEAVPRYPAGDGHCKLSAAWLIDHAGIERGYRKGPVGVSTRHTLALVHLVHHGGGTTAALCALAREVRDRVAQRFGVRLTPEPVFVGFAEPPL